MKTLSTLASILLFSATSFAQTFATDSLSVDWGYPSKVDTFKNASSKPSYSSPTTYKIRFTNSSSKSISCQLTWKAYTQMTDLSSNNDSTYFITSNNLQFTIPAKSTSSLITITIHVQPAWYGINFSKLPPFKMNQIAGELIFVDGKGAKFKNTSLQIYNKLIGTVTAINDNTINSETEELKLFTNNTYSLSKDTPWVLISINGEIIKSGSTSEIGEIPTGFFILKTKFKSFKLIKE